MPVRLLLSQLTASLCAGGSPDHIVCCLSRDSYGTSVFLQELMSALSLQQQLPPPEPSEQDFYSQFTNTNTGAQSQHSSVWEGQGKLQGLRKDLQRHCNKVPAFFWWQVSFMFKNVSCLKLPFVTSYRGLTSPRGQ